MRGMKAAINEIARAAFDEDAARQRHQESLRGEEIKEGIRLRRKAQARLRSPVDQRKKIISTKRKTGSRIAPDHRTYPKKLGIVTPARRAIVYIMKFGALPI